MPFLSSTGLGEPKIACPGTRAVQEVVRASFLPPRRASQHSSSQAAWEGSILGWGGVTGILGFLSCQPGPPSSPSSLHSLCQSSPQNPLLLLRKPRQMPSPAKRKSDPACEVAWSVPGSLSSHFAPPCPPPLDCFLLYVSFFGYFLSKYIKGTNSKARYLIRASL